MQQEKNENASTKEFLNFIGGEWVRSSSGETFRTLDPANGEVVSTCQNSIVEDARLAIDSADEALKKSWWATDTQQRSSVLAKLARFLASQKMEDAATILTRECGKPFKFNLVEYTNFPAVVENAAFRARFLTGTLTNSKSDSLEMSLREPVGVVSIIVPWNAPISLLGRSLAPALAAGCSVVIKPASATAGGTMDLIKIISSFDGLPKGIINCVTGPGGTVGSEVTKNKKVDMVSFTGDLSTGREILKAAADTVKKVSLELGGKSPNIVFADADMENAAKGAVSGACFYHAGQICFAGTRMLVDESAHEKFVRAFESTVSKMKVGHGLDPSSEIGPVVNKAQMNKVLDYIETGKKESKLVMGGYQLREPVYEKGNFIAPTLFDDVPMDSKIAQEEIFGPVVTVSSFKDVSDAVEKANDTHYGLSAAIWTNDMSKALLTAKKTKAGMVWINSQPRGSGFFNGFGIVGSAYKESGIGSMGSVEEYTLLKRIHLEFSGN
ncbi:MAG TPA: aldehyde dehydrogenase family protein [Nitrososphaerales archaeon]|nr:aldehyde dehydrogenase family protein [Nitrososphaerales archaeon]